MKLIKASRKHFQGSHAGNSDGDGKGRRKTEFEAETRSQAESADQAGA
jgi:hypothetical protein